MANADPNTSDSNALANSMIASAGSLASAYITGAWNKKATDAAAEYNYKQWLREIAYNDPSAQMARLRAAGLNPHLVYGGSGSSASGNSAVSSPEMKPYQVDIPNFIGEGIAAYQSLKGVENQTKSVESEIEARHVNNLYTMQQTMNKEAEYNNILAQGDILRQELLKLTEDTKLAKLNQIALQIANTKNEDEKAYLRWRYEYEKNKSVYDLNKAEIEVRNMELQGQKTRSEINKINKEVSSLVWDTDRKKQIAGFQDRGYLLDNDTKQLELDEKRKAASRNDRRYDLGTDRLNGVAAGVADMIDSIYRSPELEQALKRSKRWYRLK